ncbi:TPA: LPXTG cell wall anchor domain-containing protein, partial [Streptococcus suis]
PKPEDPKPEDPKPEKSVPPTPVSRAALPNTGVADDNASFTLLGLATGLVGLFGLLKKKEEK